VRGLLLLALFLAAPSSAVVIPMEVVAPCTQCDSVGTALTGLDHITIEGLRCGYPDTVWFGDIPAVGRECDSLRFDLQIDSLGTGTTYDLWATAWDRQGRPSCQARHFTLAVPWEQYASGLWGIYYADTSFAEPVNGRADANVDFDWGTTAPITGITSGRWAARWEGRLRTLTSGTYSFRAYINNGFRLWIGATEVMCCDSWSNPNTHWSSGSIDLAGGAEYPIVAEYRNEFYQAFIHLYWTPPGGTEQIVPASAFVH